nr:MAG TPA: hypothetical protein [Caudoviricetes sp.]
MSIPAISSYPPNHRGTVAEPWLEWLFIQWPLNKYLPLTLPSFVPAPQPVKL